MNRQATKNRFKERAINVAGWCRLHGFQYSSIHTLLNASNPVTLYTRRQTEAIEALKADGLYVPADGEEITGDASAP